MLNKNRIREVSHKNHIMGDLTYILFKPMIWFMDERLAKFSYNNEKKISLESFLWNLLITSEAIRIDRRHLSD
jgi:hypothetical protein